jgi:glutamyl/glutaminyl-tRNA synthetase
LKGKNLFMPLRLAITGSDHGPELVRAIPLLEHASGSDSRVLSPLARVERILGAGVAGVRRSAQDRLRDG